MKRTISRAVKKFLVYSRLDKWVADLAQELTALKRLIPYYTFYSATDTRLIKRKGVFFEVHPADFSQWQLLAGDNFDHVTVALRVLASDPDGLILDIGANCGHFSIVLAKKIKERNWNNSIISFEPNPKVFSLLERNLQLNPDPANIIRLINKGVGEKSALLELQIPIRNSGAGSLVTNYEIEPHEKYNVEIVSIDDVFQTNERPIKFIKIDVENFEYFVLSGATQAINKYKPGIYLEIGGKEKTAREEIISLLSSHGYSLYIKVSDEYVLYDQMNPNIKEMDLLALYEKA